MRFAEHKFSGPQEFTVVTGESRVRYSYESLTTLHDVTLLANGTWQYTSNGVIQATTNESHRAIIKQFNLVRK